MAQIKKYRNFKCQFCSTTIIKENGDYYIEACHIKAKADGGKDTIDNILILCPNCHKRFDYAKRENEKKTDSDYFVTLNGKEYKAILR
jgi:predicted restriction endonuclease